MRYLHTLDPEDLREMEEREKTDEEDTDKETETI